MAILALWGASRVLLLLAGLAGNTILPSGRALQNGNLQRPWTGPAALEMWARWDAEWYLLIAERGYHLEEAMAGRRVSYRPADATGFFPLYPLLVRGVAASMKAAPGVGGLVAALTVEEAAGRSEGGHSGDVTLLISGILVSNLALIGALLLLHEHARGTFRADRDGGPAPDRAALLACAALLAYPPSLFLSAVYAESLLLFLCLLCFRLLRAGRFWPASVAGALAAATKPSGLALVLPAVVAALGAGIEGGSGRRSRAPSAWLSLPVYASGVAAFSLFCAREFGDPLSWLHRQERWRGALSGPWRAFMRWAEAPQIHGAHGSTVELVFALLALGLLAVVMSRRPVGESLFAAAVVVPPLCATLWSFGRLSLQAFPLFLVLGAWGARRGAGSLLYFVPAAAGALILMAYFSAWWWAG